MAPFAKMMIDFELRLRNIANGCEKRDLRETRGMTSRRGTRRKKSIVIVGYGLAFNHLRISKGCDLSGSANDRSRLINRWGYLRFSVRLTTVDGHFLISRLRARPMSEVICGTELNRQSQTERKKKLPSSKIIW